MIKRIILIAVILFGMIQIAHARLNVMSLSEGLSDTTAAVGTACAAPITFSYHAENSNNVLDGTPQGCSDGDLIGTETSITYESASPAPQDGTYSMLFDNGGDKIVFDVSSRDIFTEVQGNISLYFYLDSFSDNRNIFDLRGDADNRIWADLKTNTDNEIQVKYRGNGVNNTLLTTDCNLTTGTWIHLIVRWQQTGDPNHLVDCNDGTTISSNTDLTAWVTDPATITFGTTGGFAYIGNLDNIQIKNTYND